MVIIPAAVENHSSDSVIVPPYKGISDPCQGCSRAVTARRVIKMTLNQPVHQIAIIGTGVCRETVAWPRELLGSNGFQHAVSIYRGTHGLARIIGSTFEAVAEAEQLRLTVAIRLARSAHGHAMSRFGKR